MKKNSFVFFCMTQSIDMYLYYCIKILYIFNTTFPPLNNFKYFYKHFKTDFCYAFKLVLPATHLRLHLQFSYEM